MSRPDDLSRLKGIVEAYEIEYSDALKAFGETAKACQSEASLNNDDIAKLTGSESRVVDVGYKLIEAYKTYIAALEKLVPR